MALKPTMAKEYSVDVKAKVSRRGRMVYVMEFSIPAATLNAAVKMRQPFVDLIVKTLSRRRISTMTTKGKKHGI